MKKYIIILASQFPIGHYRAGEETYFRTKFLRAQECAKCPGSTEITCDACKAMNEGLFKIHTIRGNYPLWAKRIAEVERGEACLSIRQWVDKPYRSKQVEIARLTKEDGIGIQRLEFVDGKLGLPRIGIVYQRKHELAINDGLSFKDWESWFKGCDKTKPMAVIHFTKFRY